MDTQRNRPRNIKMGKIKFYEYVCILLIAICGFTNGVINGQTAARHNFPSTVYFVVTTIANFNFCTGNLVGESWILTAGHCFDNRNKNDLQVFAGVYDRSQEDAAVQRREIDAIYVHPKSNRAMFHNDLALVHVKSPFSFDSSVNRAVLPDKQFKTPSKGLMIFAGWGWTKKSNDTSFPNKLQKTILRVVPQDQCEEEYKMETEELKDFSAALCGLPIQENTSLCSGDSGGGAFCFAGSRMFLCGALSYNVACARSPPPVFTFLSQDTVAWIKNVIVIGNTKQKSSVVKTPQKDVKPLMKSSEPKIKVKKRFVFLLPSFFISKYFRL